MGKFEEWIKNNPEHQALTDKSYRNAYTRENHSSSEKILVNTELATYGDAVLKLALCEILWEEEKDQLTKRKQNYESDKVLVKYIAKHYEILEYLCFDKDNTDILKDYNYPEKKNYPKELKDSRKTYDKDRNKHKYIATAIEACLGAMYMDENVSWRDIIEIVKGWKKLIDDNKKPQTV